MPKENKSEKESAREVFEMRFELPAGRRLKGNKDLQDWISAVFAVAKYQGIACELSVNGRPQGVAEAAVVPMVEERPN